MNKKSHAFTGNGVKISPHTQFSYGKEKKHTQSLNLVKGQEGVIRQMILTEKRTVASTDSKLRIRCPASLLFWSPAKLMDPSVPKTSEPFWQADMALCETLRQTMK